MGFASLYPSYERTSKNCGAPLPPHLPNHNHVSLFGNNHSLLSRNAKNRPHGAACRPSARTTP